MDEKEIEKLRKKYDLSKDEDILALYARLQTGEFDLTSALGRAFDDEIYEKAMAAKQRRLKESIEQAGRERGKNKKNRRTRKTDTIKKSNVIVMTKGELRVRRILIATLFLIMVGCLGYFAVYVMDAGRSAALRESIARKKDNKDIQAMFAGKKVDSGVSTEGKPNPTILDEYKSLYSQNKNLIGWLSIADTNIDNPVMQTEDNTYYLNHDINQKEDKNGTLFLDSACDVLKPSMNLIIYGHNMRSGNMFGSLSKYKSEDYYKNHSEILFDSIYEKGTYEVMYVFNSKIYAKDEIAFKYYQFIDASSEEEFNSNMREMEEMSLYDTGVRARYGDRLLTLSTCDYLEDDSRFVVVAKRIGTQ
ncbi:MAG: class B sortase [Lachnospiraceae bacterium]|nr:class B sortase [Lachnospiraceae bacterium]